MARTEYSFGNTTSGNERVDRLTNEAVACDDTVPFENYTLGRYFGDSWDRVREESAR